MYVQNYTCICKNFTCVCHVHLCMRVMLTYARVCNAHIWDVLWDAHVHVCIMRTRIALV
jgi:hypothetical protein